MAKKNVDGVVEKTQMTKKEEKKLRKLRVQVCAMCGTGAACNERLTLSNSDIRFVRSQVHYHEARKPAWTRSEADKLKCAQENEKIEVINSEVGKIEKSVEERDKAKLYGEYNQAKAKKFTRKKSLDEAPGPVAAV